LSSSSSAMLQRFLGIARAFELTDTPSKKRHLAARLGSALMA
jgi:hypothetical protein